MDPYALVAIAVAAVLHATWNILLKTAGDPLRTATVGVLAASAVLVPLAAIAWLATGRPDLPPSAWLVGIVSGVVETAYFVFLAAAYRRGDLSVVYPLARGSAPVLAVVVAVVALGSGWPRSRGWGWRCWSPGSWSSSGRGGSWGRADRPARAPGSRS